MRALLAIFVLAAMTPSLEVVENLVHVAMEGHLAHAVDDTEHEPQGSEHGCSGTFHVCACHASPVFLTVEAVHFEPSYTTADAALGPRGPRADGYEATLMRPPIA